MTEMITISREDLEHLQERSRKCSMDKSYLQLVIRLMNRVSAASGLEDTVDAMMRNILDVLGGANIILYYWIDNNIFSADVYGNKNHHDSIDDDLVQRVISTREAIEVEQPFSDTLLQTPEFTRAYSWVFPLLVGTELVGVIKMESLHIGARDMYQHLPTFFSFVALVLKNEILGHTRLSQAFDQLAETNAELEMEVEERIQAEEELRAARDELEERVAERTAELRNANERLEHELAERIRAQEALRLTTEEVHGLYNQAPCGYHSLNRDGIFVRINDTELEWLGYQREEIVGVKSFSDLVTSRSRQTFRENFPRFISQGWIRDLEFEMVRKDGSILPVLLSGTAIKDDDGNFVMSRSTLYDMTERKKAEEKEHLLSSIVQTSDDAIIAKDLNGIILSWNRGAERIYGYSAEESIGRHISMVVPSDLQKELPGILSAIAKGTRIDHHVTKRLRKDGSQIVVSISISPIKDSAGEIVGASAIARDMTNQLQVEDNIRKLNIELEQHIADRTRDLEEKRTELESSQKALMNIVEDLNLTTEELKEANTRLQELDRLKSMFIASMSHELRTPLNSIIGFSSIIHNGWIGAVNEEQKENLATIQRSGKHLLNLINDVIDVSKVEAGKIDTHVEEFDLHDLLTEAVQYVEKDIRGKGLELDLHLSHRQIFTDRRRLLQSVINLMSNAAKFTDTGRITVTAEADDSSGEVTISVGDTGIGIAESDIARLFQPFVRLDSPMKASIPGTGLGLYLTRKLVVEILRGNVQCSSAIGQGSTFTIIIPEKIYEKGTCGRRQSG